MPPNDMGEPLPLIPGAAKPTDDATAAEYRRAGA